MAELRFDWDPTKSNANRRKHRVTFEEARTVFFDERARLIEDPDHSEGEDRFILLGVSASGGNVIRIISARKATKSEARFYP